MITYLLIHHISVQAWLVALTEPATPSSLPPCHAVWRITCVHVCVERAVQNGARTADQKKAPPLAGLCGACSATRLYALIHGDDLLQGHPFAHRILLGHVRSTRPKEDVGAYDHIRLLTDPTVRFSESSTCVFHILRVLLARTLPLILRFACLFSVRARSSSLFIVLRRPFPLSSLL